MKLSEFEALCNKATREWHSGYVPVNEHTHWQSVGPVTFGMQQAISDAAFADAARTMAHKLLKVAKAAKAWLAVADMYSQRRDSADRHVYKLDYMQGREIFRGALKELEQP